MASAKSVEDMLSSDVDESAVSALVGSLESQLASTNIHMPSQDVASPTVTINHVNNASVVDGSLSRLHDGQKHCVSVASVQSVAALNQGNPITNSNKSMTVNSQIVSINNIVSTTTAPTNTVMVTLPGALPASGYITQVTGSQQALFNTAGAITAGRSVSVGNADIKIVYSPQPPITQLSTSTNSNISAVNSSVIHPQRSTVKVASVPNGNVSAVGMTVSRPSQSLVTIAAVNPVIPGAVTTTTQQASGASMSAIQNLANVASQQTPIIIPNACHSPGLTPQPHTVTISSQQQHLHTNVGNSKQVATARMTVRGQLEHKPTVKSQIVLKDSSSTLSSGSHQDSVASNSTVLSGQVPNQGSPNVVQVTSATPVIAVSKSQAQQSGQPVNVVTQVVSNPNIIPGVQIVNVNPARMGSSGIPGQKTLAPRQVVLSNPVRIAAAPQMIATRAGAPGVQVAGQNTFTLQPGGVVRGTILVKTENGQLQVVNVAPGLQSSSASGSIPGATTYRLQSVQKIDSSMNRTSESPLFTTTALSQKAGTQSNLRTISPQQMTVTVPVSVTPAAVKAAQQATPGTPQTVVGTVLQHGPTGLNTVNSRSSTPSNIVPSASQPQQTVTVKVSGTNSNVSPLAIQTATVNSQAANTPSQMSPNTAKKKCKNFLSTLIRLASDQPEQVAANVKNLIQGLIDGNIQPEEFTNQLQKELNSSPQPCLVPFLKKNLPYLRHSLMTRELTIDGVRAPPPGAVILPHTQGSVQQIQMSQTRSSTQQSTTQVRVMAPSGTLTAQLLQPGVPQNVINQPRLVTQQRLPTAIVTQSKSLLVTTLASKSATSTTSAVVMSPATVNVLQAKAPSLVRSPLVCLSKDKEKKSFSSLRDDDDINDVAAMGGVNLVEESQRILAANAEIVGTQIRSCKDESFLFSGPLQKRISALATKHGLDEVSSDVITLVSHATQERLKSLVEKLGVIAEHRLENIKNDSRYEITQDVKSQIKFLEELDRLEKKRHEEQEREILLRAAKSRSKLEDPEQLKLKQKAKEMQRAELEEMRQREANMTALLAIGPRKKLKTDSGGTGLNQLGLSGLSGMSSNVTKPQMRPRVKRVNLRDLLFLMEQEKETVRTPLLYKSYMK